VLFTTETSIPTLTVYTPSIPNGQAIIVCPGGGYWGTAGDHEGIQVAEALNQKGVSAFVLKYRLPDERTCIDPSLAPLQDAQQALRFVRKNAQKWHLDPQKIGILGFSAGGHLAATAATHFTFKADPLCTDTTSVRPDFVVLAYPVISFRDPLCHQGSREKLLGNHPTPSQIDFFSGEKRVTADTPPAFLVHAQDDGAVSVENSIEFYLSCTHNGVPAEMHLYPKGGHGFGLHNPTTDDLWLDRVFNWLKQL
jgi:acetyl esterase/lipase